MESSVRPRNDLDVRAIFRLDEHRHLISTRSARVGGVGLDGDNIAARAAISLDEYLPFAQVIAHDACTAGDDEILDRGRELHMQ